MITEIISGIVFWIFTWMIVAVLIGIIGSKRKIGFGGAFFLSFLLSPLIGLIFTLLSKSLDQENFEQELLQRQRMQQRTLEKIAKQNVNTIAEDLRRIKDLQDSGILNSEEYEKMKKTILDKYENTKTEETIEGLEDVKFEKDVSNLTENEMERIRNMAKTLKYGDVITKHLVNNKIEIMTIKYYEEWRKNYGQEMLKILVKKE